MFPLRSRVAFPATLVLGLLLRGTSAGGGNYGGPDGGGWYDGYATWYGGLNSGQADASAGSCARGPIDYSVPRPSAYSAFYVAVSDQPGAFPFSKTSNGYCHQCMEVTCTPLPLWGETGYCKGGSVIVQIVDTCPGPHQCDGGPIPNCPDCRGYHLDLSMEAYEAVIDRGTVGIGGIRFRPVSCPFGPELSINFRASEGFYKSFLVAGSDRPIASVSINGVEAQSQTFGPPDTGGLSFNFNGPVASQMSFPATVTITAVDGSKASCSDCIPGPDTGYYGRGKFSSWGSGAPPPPPPAAPATPSGGGGGGGGGSVSGGVAIQHSQTGLCLQPDGSGHLELVSGCDDGNSRFAWTDGGQVKHLASGQCIVSESFPPSANTAVKLSSCTGQAWALQNGDSGSLLQTATGVCAHPLGGHGGDGVQLVMWPGLCGTPEIQFQLKKF